MYTVNSMYSAKQYDIEPDISAACYFYAMNKILGTDISVKGVMTVFIFKGLPAHTAEINNADKN